MNVKQLISVVLLVAVVLILTDHIHVHVNLGIVVVVMLILALVCKVIHSGLTRYIHQRCIYYVGCWYIGNLCN